MHIKVISDKIIEERFNVSSYNELISLLISRVPGVEKETQHLRTFEERENFLITSIFPLTIQVSEKNRNTFTLLKEVFEKGSKLEKEQLLIVDAGGMNSYVYFTN